jgi:hypothetical protein
MGDNPTRPCAGSGPCPVSNCTYQTGSNNALVHLSGVRYLTFDNFELTGLCWKNTNPGGTFVWYGGAVAGYQNPFNIQNLYIHGWTYTTAGRQGGGNGFSGYNQNYGVTLQYNVIDGSDSDDLALNPARWRDHGQQYLSHPPRQPFRVHEQRQRQLDPY